MASSVQQGRTITLANIVISGALLAVIIAGIYAWSSSARGSAGGGNDYVIRMTDYAFSPSNITWKAGEIVTVTVINDSSAHPGKPHEWMMGRKANTEETPFGPSVTDGFEEPFFEGVNIEVIDGSNVTMLMPGLAKLSGKDPKSLMAPMGGMEMDQGAMGGMKMDHDAGEMKTDQDAMGGMKMDHDAGEMKTDQGAMGGMKMDQGTMAGMDMGHDMHGAEGFMPVMAATGRVTISFRVPDKPGVWTMGCFQQSGQHYLNGMRGTVTITKG